MTVRVSVIIPTVGRESCAAAEASAEGADEIIVIHDQTGDHGYTARRKGIAKATGTHLAFLDDDDLYAPGTVDLFRESAADVPVIFRMRHPGHGVLWREPRLEFGNVGTPMFLVPNKPDLLGEWAPHAPGLAEPGGDYTFIAGCVERMGGPIWRPEIVAEIRPHPTISVVTPWWNEHRLAAGYVAAMDALRHTDEPLVIDNNSSPAIEFAEIKLNSNTGFSPACNEGLRAARKDAVLFLNNDIEQTRPDWLETIRGALEPGVLVGANIKRDTHGEVGGHVLPYLDGWCLAGMREDLQELGGWDESFVEPSYYGDNDLCLRARLAGMTLRQVDVGLRHLGNGTAGPPDERIRAVTEANYNRFAARVREALGAA